MLLVNLRFASPLSFAFWLQRVQPITLVCGHDDSDASSLSLLMGSCLEGNRLRLLAPSPFHPALGIDG